jgi:hypothetical protein
VKLREEKKNKRPEAAAQKKKCKKKSWKRRRERSHQMRMLVKIIDFVDLVLNLVVEVILVM